jgi:hypothetical protein
MLQTIIVEKNKSNILCSIIFLSSRKSYRLWEGVEKCGRVRQATDGNIIRRMRLACWITKDKVNQNKQYSFFGTSTIFRRKRLNVTFIRKFLVSSYPVHVMKDMDPIRESSVKRFGIIGNVQKNTLWYTQDLLYKCILFVMNHYVSRSLVSCGKTA